MQPYYKLVRTYSDLESRDLWEYRLNLTPAQLQRLLEHAWELRDIHFDYYFFRENCALQQLLTLLETLIPLMLSDRFTLWTLPADTLRLLPNNQDWSVRSMPDRRAAAVCAAVIWRSMPGNSACCDACAASETTLDQRSATVPQHGRP